MAPSDTPRFLQVPAFAGCSARRRLGGFSEVSAVCTWASAFIAALFSATSAVSKSNLSFGAFGVKIGLMLNHTRSLAARSPRPNPALKRTRSGKPAMAFISFSAKAALPPRAA